MTGVQTCALPISVPKRDVDEARKSIVSAAKQMERDGAFKLEDLLGGDTVE